MYRFGLAIQVFLLVVALLCAGLHTSAEAEVRYRLISPAGEEIPLTAINQKREADSLVLYTSEYGRSSRTNPYGVEIAASPVSNNPNRYRVVQISSIFACQESHSLSECGNMPIPPQGVVLSATGDKRELLLAQFPLHSEFFIDSVLVYDSHAALHATNPSAETNPAGSGFPGYRGGNQLIRYDFRYGQPTTGTNEFGFEVTIRNDRVVEQEGANSRIPTDENSFVLSGHGKSSQWLMQNAPIGSRIEIQDSVVTSIIDKETYLYELDNLLEQVERIQKGSVPAGLMQQLNRLKQTAPQLSDDEVAKQAMVLQEALVPILWASYPALPEAAPRAIWHRPSESSLVEIRQSLELIQKAGINTIYLETYLHGDPIFPSSTFQAYGIPQKLPFQLNDSKGKQPDLLQLWLKEAHARGLKVHAWFQTFYAGNLQYDKTKGSILTKYPEWANVQRSAFGKDPLPASTLEAGAYFLDPANQEAQNFVLDLIDEIISQYPIDGFQLDYVRYPSSFPTNRFSYNATTWGYTPIARALFKARSGVDPTEITPQKAPELWAEWNVFKTRQVDRFVQKANSLIRIRRPDLPISAAIFPQPEESLVRKHQNWAAWARNGWLDFVVPMTLTSSPEVISADTKRVKELSSLPVVTGIFGPFNGNSPSRVIEQVWAASASGAAGVSLFDTAHLTQKTAEALRIGVFKTRENP